MIGKILLITIMLMVQSSAFAGEADVLQAEASCGADSLCNFSATVKHFDEGWEHYADKWEVLSLEGEILAVRKLAHPHVDEQPFTRSLENVTVPDEIVKVRIRAHDSVHGYGGKEVKVKLKRQQNTN